MLPSTVLRELQASPADLALLRGFYDGLYIAEFPDPDERESYENMAMYLRAAATQENGYHIVLAIEGGQPIGGSISDYFVDSKSGVIEFLVAAPARRGHGLGKRLLDDAEQRLVADAAHHGQHLGFIMAEINDPFRRSATPDNVDPFERAGWWGRRGYGRLDFPYVQPALSAEQDPVRNLMLGVKRFADPRAHTIPARAVDAAVRDYLIYAMRIPDPTACPEYVAMAHWLNGRDQVEIVPLRIYLGEDPTHPVDVHEVTSPHDPRLNELLAVYRASFHNPATTLPDGEFRRLLARRDRMPPYTYHLWALEDPAAMMVAGLASFFTLPAAGFGGYIALAPPLRGSGALPTILARIERQMVGDSATARGWYIECEDNRAAAIFSAQGFSEIAVAYDQPPFAAAAAGSPPSAPRLRLLYKAFGAQYEQPILNPADFITALRDVFRYVYAIPEPDEHRPFQMLVAQAQTWRQVPCVPADSTQPGQPDPGR